MFLLWEWKNLFQGECKHQKTEEERRLFYGWTRAGIRPMLRSRYR
jgi:hypothetical protein